MALSAWAAASDGDKAHPDLASTAAPAVVDNAGHFTGWAAVSGNVDLGGDVILSGAFQLKGQRLELPVLLHHKSDSPAGVVIVEETPYGLRSEGHLNMDVQAAREARALMRQGAFTWESIGYSVVDSFRKNGIRYLTKLAVKEISLVVFPMNPLARVTSVKAAAEEEELKQLRDLSRDMRDYFRRWAA